MNLKDIMLNEISQSIYNVLPKIVKLTETENRMVVARGWEMFNGYKVSVRQDG